MDYKNALLKKITNSRLNQIEKDIWTDFIKNAQAEQLQPIFDAIEEEPDFLAIATLNLLAKSNAIVTNNREDFKSVLKQEKDYLESVQE